jgi:hypothetical protein
MIITLCGSARFEPWFHAWNEALSLSGHVVFGLASYPSLHGGEKNWYTPEEKRILDEVHRGKIDASDTVLFLNVMAYMGESTLNEFGHAKAAGKKILFLESWGKGNGIGGSHYKWLQDAFARLGLKGGSPIDTSVYPGMGVWDLLPRAGALRSGIVRRVEARVNLALGRPTESA